MRPDRQEAAIARGQVPYRLLLDYLHMGVEGRAQYGNHLMQQRGVKHVRDVTENPQRRATAAQAP